MFKDIRKNVILLFILMVMSMTLQRLLGAKFPLWFAELSIAMSVVIWIEGARILWNTVKMANDLETFRQLRLLYEEVIYND